MNESPTISEISIPQGSEFYLIQYLFKLDPKNNLVFVARDIKRAKEVYDTVNYIFPNNTLYFPCWDTQPYDLLSPSTSITHSRVNTLNKLIRSSNNIIITSVESLAQKLVPRDFLKSQSLYIHKNQKISQDEIIKFLIHSGYERVSAAHEEGEFSVRGDIIDIYANGYSSGHRLNFFGHEIDNIKTFDPITQISISTSESFTISSPSEIVINEKTKNSFRDKLIAKFGTRALNSNTITKIEHDIRPIGIEQWYSLFYEKMDNFFDYVSNAKFLFDFLAIQNLKHHLDIININFIERVASFKDDKQNSLTLEPEYLFNNFDEIISRATIIHSNIYNNLKIKKLDDINLTAQKNQTTIFQYLSTLLSSNKTILLSANSEGGRDRIKRILADYNISLPNVNFDINKEFQKGITVTPFSHGFETNKFILITENDIFGEKSSSSQKRQQKKVKALLEQSYHFQPGELIVHKDYGIGRFKGLETISINNTQHDCLRIHYHDDDKLFLPVEYIDQVSKYGLEGDIKLDKLGTASWQSRKSKVKDQIKLSAEYLVRIAASRSLNKTSSINVPHGVYEEFCSTFPHAETDDQLNAIDDIISDFQSNTPMDRLVCGDVGFGKTEVAIRAAFIAVKSDGATKNQVAIICPTTLLSRQHYKLFSERMKKFGINVKQLSRMVTPSEAKSVIEDLSVGKVDVLIGTHAILSEKVKFKNLSLLIIDEEQHFGVEQKEKLKKLKSDINVLTLSATPIPRTLQMSLAGIKDLSLISTPPVNRLVTKTTVMAFDPSILKEAIMREYYRDGQVFYVCPRISDISDVENNIKSIAPDLKYIIAHGQMPAAKLDKVMNDFYDGKYDILISTTIIESGLDIPKANTLIVHRSDKFGLSQLYQIRGRVGRSNIPAFAYLTLPDRKKQTTETVERLQILQNIDSLGAGFSVATHDMDTRGFGNLLGDKQSGHVKEVGVELYQELLREEIAKIKNEETSASSKQDLPPQINIGLSALIPSDYIEDIDMRLNHYRRIASLVSEDEISQFIAESVDRFGPIPNEFENLISIMKLKLLCKKCHIKKIDNGPKAILIKINDQDIKSPELILNFINKNSHRIKLRSNNEILLFKNLLSKENEITNLTNFIKNFQDSCFPENQL